MSFADVGSLVRELSRLRTVELGHDLVPGMVCAPTQPGFRTALIHRHGDHVWEDGLSAAFEMIVMGTHVGTHIDASCHISHDGLLHGGASATDVLPGGGARSGSIDQVPPLVARGVLLDVTAPSGEPVPAGHEIGSAELEAACARSGVEPSAGDVACVRTGWGRHFGSHETYSGRAAGAPGLTAEGAAWLAGCGVRAVGADLMAFDVVPPTGPLPGLPAHRVLLVEAGVNIIENLWLEGLANTGVAEFVFLALPLRIRGGTASPIRPVALVREGAGG